MSEKGSDFLNQYKAISNKLKKKFLRKTNNAEPRDQFANLAAQCERNDLPQFAAQSWLAASKSESSLVNKNEEAESYLRASRLFFEAERRKVTGSHENLQTGVWCAEKSRQLLEKVDTSSSLREALHCLETGGSLNRLSPATSLPALQRADNLLAGSSHLRLSSLQLRASAAISIGDFHNALSIFMDIVKTVNKITSSPFGVYKDILIRCEISRVLLILILQPSPQKISPELAKLVEKYTWIGEPDPKTISWLGGELFFLLQSLVMSCQCEDLEAVHQLESDLWKYFSNEQRSMLHHIIQTLRNADK